MKVFVVWRGLYLVPQRTFLVISLLLTRLPYYQGHATTLLDSRHTRFGGCCIVFGTAAGDRLAFERTFI